MRSEPTNNLLSINYYYHYTHQSGSIYRYQQLLSIKACTLLSFQDPILLTRVYYAKNLHPLSNLENLLQPPEL